ncbi:MAG: type II toxin-antitoxin system prevent-host-death family antitoxin [Candidatus Coatesbacteria bacterium]
MNKNGGIPAGTRQVPAGEFKAKCLALLDRVARTGEPIVVTKRGRPVASVVAVKPVDTAWLRGAATYVGDIITPLDEKWEADR